MGEARGNGGAPTAEAATGNNGRPLDFVQPVAVVLQTFAVLVGISLTDFFDEAKNRLPEDLQPWAFVALMALLLRFIIGSAVHLTYAYGERTDQQGHKLGPRLPSICLFLKDLAFLIAFGYLAIKMSHSPNFVHFLEFSAWFVTTALLWCITDPVARGAVLKAKGLEVTLDYLWVRWAILDVGQLAAIGLVAWVIGRDVAGAVVLALSYVICLGFDCLFMLTSGRRS